MTTNLYLHHFDHYVPENKVYLKELTSLFEEPIAGYHSLEHLIEFAHHGFSLDSVRVENVLSLEEALRILLKRNIDSGILHPEAIDHILIAPVLACSLENFGAAVQQDFGMSQAKVIRIENNDALNMDLAISEASQIILNAPGKDQNILIVGGDFFGTDFKKRIFSNHAIAADNASILLLSNQHKGAKFIFKDQVVEKVQLYEPVETVDNMAVHYQAFSRCLKNMMTRNQLRPEDIKKVIVHNANLFLIGQTLSVNKIPPEKIFRANRGTYGQLGVTDLPLNLFDFGKEQGSKGDAILSLTMNMKGTHIASLFERITV